MIWGIASGRLSPSDLGDIGSNRVLWEQVTAVNLVVVQTRMRTPHRPRKDAMMKKPLLSIDEPEPKKAMRADRPPTEGFVTVVDGHFKSEFDTVEAAEAVGRKLKAAYPMLQIEIYDAATKLRTLLS